MSIDTTRTPSWRAISGEPSLLALSAKSLSQITRTVAARVICDNDFAADGIVLQEPLRSSNTARECFSFVEAGHDNRELQRGVSGGSRRHGRRCANRHGDHLAKAVLDRSMFGQAIARLSISS